MGNGNIIEATGIRKTYDTGRIQVHALRGVDLTVRRGEMVAIMGPSGCGKTTLLNCLSGLDGVDAGEVIIDGVPLARMTDDQRKTVRKCIADITRGKTYIGLDHPPAFHGNTSNWNIIHANLLPMVLAIEGEEGYDAGVYRRIVEGLRKWVYVASGPGGAPFEGLNKSAYGAVWLLPLAKRGEAFLGTEYSRNHARKFLLHTMLPWGGEHIFETGIGGLQKDIRYFKHAHPTDPVIDILYATTVHEKFAPDARGTWPNIRTTYAPPWDLFVADDPLGAMGGSYDFDQAFDAALADLQKNEPLVYYSDYRGLMTARSGWSARNWR